MLSLSVNSLVKFENSIFQDNFAISAGVAKLTNEAAISFHNSTLRGNRAIDSNFQSTDNFAAPLIDMTDCSANGVVFSDSRIEDNIEEPFSSFAAETYVCNTLCFLSWNFRTYAMNEYKNVQPTIRLEAFSTVKSRLEISANSLIINQK